MLKSELFPQNCFMGQITILEVKNIEIVEA